MIFRIDPLSAEPIAAQVAFQVKGAVARGELRDGSQLPSVRELARELAVNPNTVVRAYDSLEHDGVIRRRQGAGCFVTGETSDRSRGQRHKQLRELVNRTVTEAFHLGFAPTEIREAIDRSLKGIQFNKRKKA